MRNKLIILSFACLLGFSSIAQNQPEPKDVKISVYPNPATEYLMVQLDEDNKNVKFELNSMIGNKLEINPEPMGDRKYKISVKDLATGYYFLIVTNESEGNQPSKKAFRFLKR